MSSPQNTTWPEAIHDKISARFVVWYHLFFSLLVFSPFLFCGTTLMGSTDSFYHAYPNMLFAYNNFHNGDPGFWNPFILGGSDFSASTHNHLFYPLNWPIFLFPEKYLFQLLTVRILIELWLIGVFGFLFFQEELADKRWALFSSTILQLSGYAIFSLTAYPHASHVMFLMIGSYLVWTLKQRRLYLSYIYLTLSALMIILNGNMVYGTIVIFTLTIMFIYRFWPESVNPFGITRYAATFYGAMSTTVLLSMARTFPFAMDLVSSSRVKGASFVHGLDGYYFGMTAFVPEILGLNMSSSMKRMSNLMLGRVGDNASFHAYPYFGAITIILALWAILYVRDRKTIFWSALLSIATLWFLDIPPVAQIAKLLANPFIHPIIPKAMILVSFCALAGHTGKHLETNWRNIEEKNFLTIGIIFLLVILSLVVIFAIDLPRFAGLSRIVILATTGFISLGIYLFRYNRRAFYATVTTVALLIFAACLTFALRDLSLTKKVLKNALFMTGIFCVLATIFCLVVIGVALKIVARETKILPPEKIWGLFALAGMVVVFTRVYPFPSIEAIFEKLDYVLALFGSARMLLALSLFVFLLTRIKSQKVSPSWLFPFFLAIAIVDLFPFGKEYENINTQLFYQEPIYHSKERILDNWAMTRGFKNFLANDSFELWEQGEHPAPVGWQSANIAEISNIGDTIVVGQYGISLAVNMPGYLYQDVSAKDMEKGFPYTFGVWIKTNTPRQVQVTLSDGTNSNTSNFHTGGGGWEWMTVTCRLSDSATNLRSQISLSLPGEAYADGAILAKGQRLLPFYGYPQTPEYSISRDFIPALPLPPIGPLDIKNYRLTNPHIALKISRHELSTLIPSLHKIRVYGGINSNVSQIWGDFMKAFTKDKQQPFDNAAYSYETDPRFLDLMGCRYDVNDAGDIIIRPTALSRFMLFEDFKVVNDDALSIAELKSPDFNPRTTVLLTVPPDFRPATPTDAKILEFEQTTTSHLNMSVNTPNPGVVFFNDVYNKDWKAYIDGIETPVIRADYAFMAIAVTPGNHKVVFRFEPAAFYKGVFLSSAGIVLFLLAGVALCVLEKTPPLYRSPLTTQLIAHLKNFGLIYMILLFVVFLVFIRAQRVTLKSEKNHVTASSALGDPKDPSELFMGPTYTWHAQSPPHYPEWVEVEYDNPVKITHLGIRSQEDSLTGDEHNRGPRDFIFQGRLEGSEWKNLLTVKDNHYRSSAEWKEWTFKNNEFFTHYRILVTASSHSNLLTILQLRMD